MADHVDYGRDRHKTVVILQLKRKKFFFFFFKALFYLTFSCFLYCVLLETFAISATCSHCLHQTVNF